MNKNNFWKGVLTGVAMTVAVVSIFFMAISLTGIIAINSSYDESGETIDYEDIFNFEEDEDEFQDDEYNAAEYDENG